MAAKSRRRDMVDLLKKREQPIKGTDLAKQFEVSRQVIVQDIAILRAEGEDILATPQGYIMLASGNQGKLIKTIAAKHTGYKAIEDELKTIIDLGGKVIDVSVEHPIYGEIKGNLMIGSRLEIEEFMKNLNKEQAEPLATLTDGVHIHTLEVPSEDVFQKIQETLLRKNYLIHQD